MLSPEVILQCVFFMNFGGQTSYDFKTSHCTAMKTKSTVSTFNRACNSSDASLQEILDVKNFFGDSFYKWAVPSTDSHTIALLEQAGIKSKASFPGMMLNIAALKPATYKDGIEVRQINLSEVDIWVAITHQVYNYPRAEVEKFLRYCSEKNLNESIKFYIGYYQGEPASSCMVIEHIDRISFHLVGTLKEFRGKGLGHAIVHKPLTDAQMRNFKQAFLISSDLGKKVYSDLGFEEFVSYKFYGNY